MTIGDENRSYFVANVRQLRWQENELGASCEFDKHRERFPELGINPPSSWPSGTGSARTSSSTRETRLARKHGAGVEQETPHPKEAYARFMRQRVTRGRALSQRRARGGAPRNNSGTSRTSLTMPGGRTRPA